MSEQAARDRSLVEHLAIHVMGWGIDFSQNGKRAIVCPGDGTVLILWTTYEEDYPSWNPLGSWADAGMVLERFTKSIAEAKEGEFWLDGLGFKCCDDDADGMHGRWRCWVTNERGGNRGEYLSTADSGPRAICEAIAKATGWKEPVV